MSRQIHYEPVIRGIAPARVGAAARLETPRLDDAWVNLGKQVASAAHTAGSALGRMYVARKTGEVDDELLEVSRRFSQWQADYNSQHQGRLGLEAAKDYAEAWGRLAQESIDRFDAPDHEVFGDLLRRRLQEKGLQALQTGLGYQNRQAELWQHSQQEAQAVELEQFAQGNPLDEAGIAREAAALKGAWVARNPGLNPAAFSAKVDKQVMQTRIESLLANGDTAAVRAILSRPQAQKPMPVPGSLSERNLSVWNLGNVTRVGGGFQAYADRHSGLMGIGERFLRYHDAPENGWHASTISELMHIYAPPKENNTQAYINFLCGQMGVRPDQKLDFSDPETMASFIQAIPKYEHLASIEIGRDEALAAARDVLAGRKPQLTGAAPTSGRGYGGYLNEHNAGVSPAQAQAWLAKADAIDRQNSAGQRQELERVCKSYMAASANGHVMDIPVSREQIIRAYGEEAGAQAWDELNRSHALALDLSAIVSLPDAEQNAILQSRQPSPQSADYQAEQAYFTQLGKAVATIQKQRHEDAAGYLQATSPQAARAAQAFRQNVSPETWQAYRNTMLPMLAAQGLPSTALLSASDSALLTAFLSSSPNPAEASQRLQAALGEDFNSVLGSISKNLPADTNLLAAGVKPEASRLIMEELRNRDFEKEFYSLFKTDVARSDFEAQLLEQIDPYARSFMGGGSTDLARSLQKQTRILAAQYMRRQGLNQDKAIEKAVTEIIGSRYHLAENYLPARGGWFSSGDPAPACRIPKTFQGRSLDADTMESGLHNALLRLSPQTLDLRAYPGADENMTDRAYQRLVRENAYWLTNENETGVILFMNGMAVRGRDGREIRRSWQDIEDEATGLQLEEGKVEE